jgi:aminoglycoside phosphotransferase (APT) family kinase protein
MDEQLIAFLRRRFPDAESIEVAGFAAIPGGYSRETYRFDARIQRGGRVEEHPLILRKDPPSAAAILQTSRQTEHELIEAVRQHTSVPVCRSYGAEMDPAVFGEPAMVIERMPGSGMTSNLFHGGPDCDQADSVMAHLCETLVALHSADVSKLNASGKLDDPRNVGIDTSSWERYMETTFEYYINGYGQGDFAPIPVIMDGYLTVRRERPPSGRLALVHGDFNPVNFLYENGRVTAVIDWENARIGDPREDLGWMQTMDLLSNTEVMAHPKPEGGFLAYYNKLTGSAITQDEVNYFALFGTCNIAVPVAAAVKRRIQKEHMELLHLYIIQPSVMNFLNFANMLKYPGLA